MTSSRGAQPAEAAPGVRERALLGAPELAPEVLLGRAAGENFTVAMAWLPRADREALLSLYGVTRLIDEAGDSAAGDRLALLDAVEADLERAPRGAAVHPLVARLGAVLRERALPLAPLLRLVEANRWDQRTPRMADWAELEGYCALSATPVGELVLHVFGQADEVNVALSDAVCTALQLVEHCQDVAEDAAAGRIYLPGDELRRFGCAVSQLREAPAPAPLREVVAFQVGRARGLLTAGERLVAALRGRARPVVAAYVAGGFATCRALERARFDVNSAPVRGRRRDRARETLRLLASGRRAAARTRAPALGAPR